MLKYATAIVITIVLGLSTRWFPDVFPDFIVVHAGDILWASMIYFGIRLFCLKRSLAWAVGWSIIFCFGIEFSQMYQAEWIVEIRRTLVGSLILGKGFLVIDLCRYVIGVAVGLIFDKYAIQRSNR